MAEPGAHSKVIWNDFFGMNSEHVSAENVLVLSLSLNMEWTGFSSVDCNPPFL